MVGGDQALAIAITDQYYDINSVCHVSNDLLLSVNKRQYWEGLDAGTYSMVSIKEIKRSWELQASIFVITGASHGL